MLEGRERALATVDLAAVGHNVRRLTSLLPRGGALCAVVKANGYGHGAVPVARAALRAGAACLGVATAVEAEELRDAALAVPVLVFGPLTGNELRRAAKAQAEVVVWSQAMLDEALRLHVRVHVKHDSGMGRLGVGAREAASLCDAASGAGCLSGFMTHFATADEDDDTFFRLQLERFAALAARVKSDYPDTVCHAANSAATLREPAAHFDMVRAGIAIYGLSPFHDDPAIHDLRPALRLTSYVAAVREIESGDSVGYGRTFVAESPARVGIVPIGYGDGVARALSNRGEVLVDGRRCRIAGTISMDQMTVLLPGDHGAPGDEVVFIGGPAGDPGGDDADAGGDGPGAERILAEEVAGLLGTINYEVTCDVGSRVARRFSGGVNLV